MVDILFRGFVDCADRFLGGWVDALEGLAVQAFDELVVDEAAITVVSLPSEQLVGARRSIVG